MLSTEPPPEAPCSRNAVGPKSDERAHPPERFAFLEPDPAAGEAEATHFSIRTYVLASRSKDIGTNWPFPKQYLQLCLEHGVRNLLPPFERPDLVRARFSGNFAESQLLVSCSDVVGATNAADPSESKFLDPVKKSGAVDCKHSASTHKSVLGSSNQSRGLLSDDKPLYDDAERELTVTSLNQNGSIPSPTSEVPHPVKGRRFVLEVSSEVEAAKHLSSIEKVETLHEPSVKKCRLIVKFSGTPEPNRTADPAPALNSSSVLESMASKVCPVCRIFSSTSNTTLNAHIDQCLSMESSSIGDVTKLSKHKVKPRKKRSMVEILASAPCCTLEDLDRRNGTSWALGITLAAPVNEVSSACEGKRSRVTPLDANDSGSEGAVYVDSNGTKLRILSKLNDAQPEAAADCPKSKKFQTDCRQVNGFLFGKKCFPSGHKALLKTKIQSKKMNSFKKLKGKIHKALVGNYHMDMSCMEETKPKSSSTNDQTSSMQPLTLQRWACSKRSGLPKHLNEKLKDRRPRSPVLVSHQMSVEGDSSAAGDSYAVRQHSQKLSTLSNELASPVKTRSVDMLSNIIPIPMSQEKHSAIPLKGHSGPVVSTLSATRGLPQKIPRSPGDHVSSTGKKGMNIPASVAQISDGNLTTEISKKCNTLGKRSKSNSKKFLLLERSQHPLETTKCADVVQSWVPKSLRKHQLAENFGKQAEISKAAVIGHVNGIHDLGLGRNNVISGTLQLNVSMNMTRPETRDTFDQVSPSPSNLTDPIQGDDDSHQLVEEECTSLNQVQQRVECDLVEVVQAGAQYKALDSLAVVVKSSSEEAVGKCAESEAVSSGDHTVATCDRSDLYPSLNDPKEPSAESESVVDPSIPRWSGDKGICCGDVSHDIQRVGEMEARDDCCSELQTVKSRTGAASFQGTCACLTSHQETIFELLQENPSTGSVKTMYAHNPFTVIDGESSRSPVSAASSISDASVEEPKFKDGEPRPSLYPFAIKENSRSDYSSNLAFLIDERVRGTERTIFEKRTHGVMPTSHITELDNFPDGQACCCSRKEKSIPQESHFLRQSIMAGMAFPMKQMASDLSIRPVMSSLGAYLNFRPASVPAVALESPTDSISANESSGFHPGFPTSKDYGSESPSCCSQSQSTSNPVVRLMGKNLMVVNREERPVQQNQYDTCSTPDISHAKHLSLLGRPSTCSLSNQVNNFYHPHQFLEGHIFGQQHPAKTQVLVSPPYRQINSFVGTPPEIGSTTKSDSQAHQKRWNGDPSPPSIYDLGRVCLPHQRQRSNSATRPPFPESELIVINDSPEHEVELNGVLPSPASTLLAPSSRSEQTQVRPFSCFPSESPLQLRELGHGIKPGFPVPCPPANTDFTKWGGNTGPLLPSYFDVPSLSGGYLAPTVCYSTNFR